MGQFEDRANKQEQCLKCFAHFISYQKWASWEQVLALGVWTLGPGPSHHERSGPPLMSFMPIHPRTTGFNIFGDIKPFSHRQLLLDLTMWRTKGSAWKTLKPWLLRTSRRSLALHRWEVLHFYRHRSSHIPLWASHVQCE
ncbi:hypothetical protein BS78_09G058700 [Paspalum vaginatum]|nr:hypothetical protein BS78_09G058700 [Paspalum vaginatum]